MAKLLHQPISSKLLESYQDGNLSRIKGVFFMSERKNRNGRFYPKKIMEMAIDKYIKEYVNEGLAIGELNHPDYIIPDPRKACIRIDSLKWDGDNVIGEAIIINNEEGKNVRALLEAGYRLGVSSRAVGSLIKDHRGDVVQDDLEFHAVDAVHKPSAQLAYVDAIYESTNWEKSNGIWVKNENILIENDKDKTQIENKKGILESFKNAFNAL